MATSDTLAPSAATRHGVMAWAAARPVVLIGSAMVVAQLAFRAWAISHAWFQQDDFAFMQRSLGSGLTWDFMVEPHVGHLMPAGFLLSWINAHIAPLNFALPATELLVMQLVASLGCLRLLRHMFGDRWGILPPLALFLFSAMSFPAFAWWAAGVNQLPVLITFFFGLHSHVSYLRSRRFRHAVFAMLWTAFGLAFCEKSILAFELYGLVALCYFAQGHFTERLHQLWRNYRPGALLYSGVAVVYLPYYLMTSINFAATDVASNPLGGLAKKMVGVAFSTALVGGPLDWSSANVFSAIAAPSDLVVLLSWIVIGSIVFVAARTRVRSKRAWSIVGAVIATDVMLVATGRAFVVGPVIGLEYRYQTEAVAAAAISLALAFLPLRGALESAEPSTPHSFVDSRRAVALASCAVAALGCYSSVRFFSLEHAPASPERYFAHFEKGLRETKDPVVLADRAVPERIWTAFAFPGNLYSRMFVMFSDQTRYQTMSEDTLNMVDSVGNIKPVAIDTVRRNVSGRRGNCGYRVSIQPVRIPLDGPVIGGGWWLRVGYLATSASPVTVTIGDHVYDTRVRAGVHSLYFEAGGEFDDLTISGLDNGAKLCTNDVTLGMPQPFEGR